MRRPDARQYPEGLVSRTLTRPRRPETATWKLSAWPSGRSDEPSATARPSSSGCARRRSAAYRRPRPVDDGLP